MRQSRGERARPGPAPAAWPSSTRMSPQHPCLLPLPVTFRTHIPCHSGNDGVSEWRRPGSTVKEDTAAPPSSRHLVLSSLWTVPCTQRPAKPHADTANKALTLINSGSPQHFQSHTLFPLSSAPVTALEASVYSAFILLLLTQGRKDPQSQAYSTLCGKL